MKDKDIENNSAVVPSGAKQAENIQGRWPWAKRCVWSDRMLWALAECILRQTWVIPTGESPRFGPIISIYETNYRLESRMRENRQSGSEGGARFNSSLVPTPIQPCNLPSIGVWSSAFRRFWARLPPK